MTFTRSVAINNWGPAKFVVDGTTVANGTHSTIAAALTSSASGDTIFIRPGTYTENLTLKAGVNLVAFAADALTPNVTIIGTCTLTVAGTASISGIRLQTNSAAIIAVTGSAASILNLQNCYLNCTNNTGITFSSSSASAKLNIYNCNGNLGTTGIAYFTHTSAGTLDIQQGVFNNSGVSVTASTCSAGNVIIDYAYFLNPVTSTGTGSIYTHFTTIQGIGNTIALTIGGSTGGATDTILQSGSAAALSVSTNFDVNGGAYVSSAANAITGAGTVNLGSVSLLTTSDVNPTTLGGYKIRYGQFRSSTQPAFLAYLGSIVTNVTGNGTIFTLGTTTAMTEVFDQNANYNTNGTFTAPLTGRYNFSMGVVVAGCTIAALLDINFVTSNRSYTAQNNRVAGSLNINQVLNALCDMDSADTMTATVAVSGEAAATDDVYGTTFPFTFVSGILAC